MFVNEKWRKSEVTWGGGVLLYASLTCTYAYSSVKRIPPPYPTTSTSSDGISVAVSEICYKFIDPDRSRFVL